ncbi:hypothetical protein B0H19DRAFT_1189210 [Mycena capillaripes]|nr:hypothetical protein B0H19DRAFT_1189210 [Mycena capillaripes]
MNIIVSDAVHNFLSSAPSHLRFPSLTDHTWDATLACTERELDAKRSLGLLALHSHLEQALIRTAELLDDRPDRETLREIMLSDDVLACILVRAGVCESCAGHEREQVSRALLVFVEMVIMDGGLQEFVPWFARTFDPIVSIAFEACSECRSKPAGTTPTKRTFPFHDGAASKRRRTAMDTSVTEPVISSALQVLPKRKLLTGFPALDVLRQLRQRQTLSTSEVFTYEICIMLNASPITQTVEGVLADETYKQEEIQESPPEIPPANPVPSPVWLSPTSFSATKDTTSPSLLQTSIVGHHEIGSKWSPEDPTPVLSKAISTSKSESILAISSAAPYSSIMNVTPPVSPTPCNLQPFKMSIPSKLQTPHASPIPSDVTDDSAIKELAVLFINETIEMVERGEIWPTQTFRVVPDTVIPRVIPDTAIPTIKLRAQDRSADSRSKAQRNRHSTNNTVTPTTKPRAQRAQDHPADIRSKAQHNRPSTKKRPKTLPLTGGVLANIPLNCSMPKKIPTIRLCELPSGLKAENIQAFIDSIAR